MFKVDNIVAATDLSKKKFKSGKKYLIPRLNDEELSEGLHYLYKKATNEVFKYHDKKFIHKRGILTDGVLFCKTRVLEGQELKIVGGLEDKIDLHSLTGISFQVPLIYKNSPLAISIAHHLHYDVVKHMGAESVHRLSLQYVHILNGRSLFKQINDDCIYCKKIKNSIFASNYGTSHRLSTHHQPTLLLLLY